MNYLQRQVHFSTILTTVISSPLNKLFTKPKLLSLKLTSWPVILRPNPIHTSRLDRGTRNSLILKLWSLGDQRLTNSLNTRQEMLIGCVIRTSHFNGVLSNFALWKSRSLLFTSTITSMSTRWITRICNIMANKINSRKQNHFFINKL